ncbi:MAG: hypothetical protein PHI28_14185, partial [Mangrovibacterium sp.]|nr:hypothetical protein [Mangrovibacterium sp.]
LYLVSSKFIPSLQDGYSSSRLPLSCYLSISFNELFYRFCGCKDRQAFFSRNTKTILFFIQPPLHFNLSYPSMLYNMKKNTAAKTVTKQHRNRINQQAGWLFPHIQSDKLQDNRNCHA